MEGAEFFFPAVNKGWQMEREAEDVESAWNINKNKELWEVCVYMCVCFLLQRTLAWGLGFTEQICMLTVELRDTEAGMKRKCIAAG